MTGEAVELVPGRKEFGLPDAEPGAAARAAGSLDLLTVVSFTMFTSVVLIVANLVIDVLYALLDPRVRLS